MTDLRLSIATHLTSVERLIRNLADEALHRYADKEYPGGPAMTMLGPVANLEAFNYRQLSELMGRTYAGSGADDLDSDPAPPLLVLAGWAEVVSDERGDDRRQRATIEREAKYLRDVIDWITGTNADGDPYFLAADELDRDLGILVRRLEGVLHDGEAIDRIRAECTFCDHGPRLVVNPGEAEDRSDDTWFCPSCERPYDTEGVAACWRQMFVRRGNPPVWITLRQAAAAIKRPVSSVRTWTLQPLDSFGKPKMDRNGKPKLPRVESEKREDGRTWVRWSDVRAVEDTTHRRGRNRNVA